MPSKPPKKFQKSMHTHSLTAILGCLLLAAVIYLNIAANPLRIAIPWLQPDISFIARNDTRFVDGSSPFYVNGWNSYWMLSSNSPVSIKEMFERGRQMGLSVCRTWGFNDGGLDALQISPGVFNERIFQGLDYIIYEARRNKIRLLLCLVNNLDAFGGKSQYVKWATEAGVNSTSSTDSFYSNPVIKKYYKDYVKTIITRKNTYSGVRYYDEPAIFAWELMNEPRCASNSSAPFLQKWISEMASYIKTLDQKHLVTVGLEGFYSYERTEKLGINPGNWASSLGSDFIKNSADKNIDFASVHAYPDSWLPNATLEEKTNYLSIWVDSHVNDSEHVLKKPVLFSEVGSHLELKENGLFGRDLMLQIVYDKIYESAKKGQAGAGALIWQLMANGVKEYHDEFSLVATDYPSTYKLITGQSCRLSNLFRRKKQKCRITIP